jgi:multidrug efflux pump subunit AcrB
MVLAIGLLVDDAIVVVENVERVMAEEGLTPKEATRKSMSQITGALVGIAMVLSAVFLPMAFFGGSTGVIFRQFSITIATAMVACTWFRSSVRSSQSLSMTKAMPALCVRTAWTTSRSTRSTSTGRRRAPSGFRSVTSTSRYRRRGVHPL